MFLRIKIAERDGQRLDNFLIRVYKKTPKHHVYRMIRKGRVRVNGKRCRQHHYQLREGDELMMPEPQEQSVERPPSERLCDRVRQSIINEYPDFWVLNKPAGMSVHQSNDELHGVVEVMRYLFGDAHLVHRLDRGTSGCLVIAKDYAALVKMTEIWRQRTVVKRYLALLDGSPEWDKTKVSAPLSRLTQGGDLVKVVVDQSGQEAVSHFEIKQRFKDCVLSEVEILTGRTHQIRVHAQHLGHPVCGDRRYGRGSRLALKRMFLHASQLKFDWCGEALVIEAPLGDDEQSFLNQLR